MSLYVLRENVSSFFLGGVGCRLGRGNSSLLTAAPLGLASTFSSLSPSLLDPSAVVLIYIKSFRLARRIRPVAFVFTSSSVFFPLLSCLEHRGYRGSRFHANAFLFLLSLPRFQTERLGDASCWPSWNPDLRSDYRRIVSSRPLASLVHLIVRGLDSLTTNPREVHRGTTTAQLGY